MLDYHVHLWPHEQRAEAAEQRLERLATYCERATAHGVGEIALTEHLFRFTAVRGLVGDFWECEPEPLLATSIKDYFAHHATAELDSYVEAVLAAKAAGLPLLLGLEVDYYPGKMEAVAAFLAGYPFDVLLGSVHWLGTWMFDNLGDAVATGEWARRDRDEVWREYTRAVEELAATRAVDVLAHPDFVKVAGLFPSSAARRVRGAHRRGGGELRPRGGDLLGGAAQARRRDLPLSEPARRARRAGGRGDDGLGQPRPGRSRRRLGGALPRRAGGRLRDTARLSPARRPRRPDRGAVSEPRALAQEFTGLDAAARQHLERLTATWGLLADLSFSDLLLFVPVDHYSLAVAAPGAREGVDALLGLHFMILGQMRPTTSQTLVQLDVVGQLVGADEWPVVAQAWERGALAEMESSEHQTLGPVRTAAIPVRFKGEVIAILLRVWSPTGGRRTGGLERVYLQLFDRLAAMVNDGLYPFLTEDEMMEEAPRAGDGVIVLDGEQRVTFASPNAVNALHRMRILTQFVDSTLEELGIDSTVVRGAFEASLPAIDEVERLGEVTLLVHCIPLIEEGEVTGAAVLLRDVTDLRRRDRLLLSKDAAIREVHHRVKNNLQTISSLLRLQSRRLEDPAREALLESERRITAISLVHEILAREPGEQVRFDEIIPALVHLTRDADVSGHAVEVTVHGDVGDLSADVATPLAVVIAELLQNAVEHAFNDQRGRSAQITLELAAHGGVLDVEVRDNGSGFEADFDLDRTPSLGLAIVRDLVRSQLGGSISVRNDGGAAVQLAIPLAPGAMGERPASP